MCSFMAIDVAAAGSCRDEMSDLWSIADLEPENLLDAADRGFGGARPPYVNGGAIPGQQASAKQARAEGVTVS